MRGLDPRIHVFVVGRRTTWMAGTSPAKTTLACFGYKTKRASRAGRFSPDSPARKRRIRAVPWTPAAAGVTSNTPNISAPFWVGAGQAAASDQLLVFQPKREVLLQICCRCSHRQQSVQLIIVASRTPAAPPQITSVGVDSRLLTA